MSDVPHDAAWRTRTLDQLAKEMRAVAITARMPPTVFDRDEIGRRCDNWADRLDILRKASRDE